MNKKYCCTKISNVKYSSDENYANCGMLLNLQIGTKHYFGYGQTEQVPVYDQVDFISETCYK